MSTELKLPKLGENVDSGVVSKVLVSVGDSVTDDQPVIELDTEKATVEVPAATTGTIKEIRIKEGETIKVGQVILVVDEQSKQKENRAEPEAKSKAARAEAEPQKTPELELREQAEAQETETHAAPAPEKRIVTQTKPRQKKEQQTEEAGPGTAQHQEEAAPIRREQPPQPPRQRQEGAARAAPETGPQVTQELAPAAPSVRRLARELGVDINEVTGSSDGGRISEEDVRNYARSIIINVSRPSALPQAEAAPTPDFTRWGEVERQPMTRVRRKTAEHTHEAWLTIPHVTQFDQADITALEELRNRFAEKAEAAGGKLTITAIALKVVTAALKRFPQFNASLDIEQEEIIYKKYYHIGVAVDTDRGLLVPVIRDVDKKNLVELSVELTQAAERARTKKITLDEMQGGTFTITNLGGIGGSSFTPIVNSPEVAILGISRAATQPLFVEGQFEPRLLLPLTLSYDHRLIDGADAARFLRWVAQAFEQPFLLALEG